METNFQLERQIMKHVVRTAGILVILILVSGEWKVLWGYLFALLIGGLVFTHTLSTTGKVLRMSEKQARIYMGGRYVLHYLIYGCALAVAYKSPNMSFPGAVIGLLTVKIGLFSWAFGKTIVHFFKSGFKRSRKDI